MKVTDLFMIAVAVWACLNTIGTVQYIIIGCVLIYVIVRVLRITRG